MQLSRPSGSLKSHRTSVGRVGTSCGGMMDRPRWISSKIRPISSSSNGSRLKHAAKRSVIGVGLLSKRNGRTLTQLRRAFPHDEGDRGTAFHTASCDISQGAGCLSAFRQARKLYMWRYADQISTVVDLSNPFNSIGHHVALLTYPIQAICVL